MAKEGRPIWGVAFEGSMCVQCGEPEVAPMSISWICDYDLPEDPGREVPFCRSHYAMAAEIAMKRGAWLAADSHERWALVHATIWDTGVTAIRVRREQPGSPRDSGVIVEPVAFDLAGVSRSDYRIVGWSTLVSRLPTMGDLPATGAVGA